MPSVRHPHRHQRLGPAKAVIGTIATAGMIVPADMLLRAMTLRNRPVLRMAFHRALARALGVRITSHGRDAASSAGPGGRPAVLYVCNHLSWADIPVLGARIRAAFVAKSDVAGWGPVGWLASYAGTIYVSRERRHSAGEQKDAIAARLARGESVILFPEGTNGDGVDVLPFKSALFSAVAGAGDVLVQPVTLAYTRINGMPATRRHLPYLAWIGDTQLGPHAMDFMALGKVQAEILFHDPVRPGDFADRKSLARHCETVIAQGYRRLMRG